MASLFATHAAHALGNTMTQDQLTEAMGSRTIIGQAMGIVMERYGLDQDRAFAFLTRLFQTSNVKMREVAGELVSQMNDGHRAK